MPRVPFWHIDAFADGPFSGNPAAVCLFPRRPAPGLMAALAAEMNLSETAFLWPCGPARYGLRWYTPTEEVKLCGHGTLASAAALFFEEKSATGIVEFETLSGVLRASLRAGAVEIELPELAPAPVAPTAEMLRALGLDEVVAAALTREGGNLLLRLQDEQALRDVRPDFAALVSVKEEDIGGVIVTAPGTGPYDFVSRYFAPWCGIPEDPVTGSAHATLAPYWAPILGKDRFRALQASTRGGVLEVRRERGRVLLSGKTVTVVRGRLSAEASC